MCSTKHQSFIRAHGMPSLLDNVVQGAAVYFLVIFTGHLLVIPPELLASVSDRLAYLRPSTHYELHIGTGPTPSYEVSHHLECCSGDGSDGVPSHI